MIARFGLIALGMFIIAYGATEPLRQGVADLLLTFNR